MPSKELHLTDSEIAAQFTWAWGDRYPPTLSPNQLAELLGLSPKTVHFWIAKGRLDHAYRKRGKRCLIGRDRAFKLIFDGKDW